MQIYSWYVALNLFFKFKQYKDANFAYYVKTRLFKFRLWRKVTELEYVV